MEMVSENSFKPKPCGRFRQFREKVGDSVENGSRGIIVRAVEQGTGYHTSPHSW